VILPFVGAYLEGKTPNPCVVCNEAVKFKTLLRYAEQNGAGYVATGHYARRMSKEGSPVVELWRGEDRKKEQSYFLHRLTQHTLARCIFPLGTWTKIRVREKAKALDLPVHARPESQEICFLPHKDYRVLVEAHEGAGTSRKGNIVDLEGRIVGQHRGAWRYTIGQRRGLGIAASRPYYVKEIRARRNEVVVGRKEDLFGIRVEADRVSWIEGLPPAGRVMRVQAQVRYRHGAAWGRLNVLSPGSLRFTFDDPQWAITPGQALVFYDGERVLGGGWITRT